MPDGSDKDEAKDAKAESGSKRGSAEPPRKSSRKSSKHRNKERDSVLTQMLGPDGESYLGQQPPLEDPEFRIISESNENLLKDVFEHFNEGPNCYYWLMGSSCFWIQFVLPQFKDLYTFELNEAPPLYNIFNERGNLVFRAINTSKFRENRGPCKPFSFIIMDSAGSSFLRVTRRLNCFCETFIRYFPYWCFGPYKNEAVIENVDSSFSFLVKQECRLCNCDHTSFVISDVSTGHKLCYVDGPGDICALRIPHGLSPSDIPTFTFKNNKDDVVAVLRKTYVDGTEKEKENYKLFSPLTLTFTKQAELMHRVIAVGCTFLFDYMFLQE